MSERCWVNRINDEISVIRGEASRLRAVANAMVTLGMNNTRLVEIAESLDEAADNISDIANETFNKECKQAQQATADVFKAALAGLELSERK